MVAFEIKDKVALVTGGASGIGYQFVLSLLEKGARGVTIADFNSEDGNRAVVEFKKKYGENRVIFVKVDVSNNEQFEDAFKKTIEAFKNIDIVINNAGTMNPMWQKQISTNVIGTIHGILLAIDNYLPKFRSGSEGVIVNISSLAGLAPFGTFPIYSATKFAIVGMTLSWGLPYHYDRTKVRVVAVCPGPTETPMLDDLAKYVMGSAYDEIRIKEVGESLLSQKSEPVASGVMQVIEKAPSGTLWMIKGGEPPEQYIPKYLCTTPQVQH